MKCEFFDSRGKQDLFTSFSVYVLLSFGAPMLFVWIPFTADAYGPSGAWWYVAKWFANLYYIKFQLDKE